MECIVLAGGLGTRLRSVIGEMPKCMAPVAGIPFLRYLLQYLSAQGITRVVLSLGYGSEQIIAWLPNADIPLTTDWVIEQEPLGTGGGIRMAMAQCRAKDVFVVNGDTMFIIDMAAMMGRHMQVQAETTLALKAMNDFDRYGTVCSDDDSIVMSFEEKTPKKAGNINGGIYLIDRHAFLQRALPEKSSFEKDYLERYVGEQKFYAYVSDGYFIDIGVPQDYEQAQQDFKTLFPGT